MDILDIFRQAEKEVAESGNLGLTERRKIWQTMGEIEPRKRDSLTPRSLTEPLKKRALLALACAKKVMPMWCSVDPDDKRPQNLIKKSLAYIDGKIGVKDLRAERKQSVIDDFMNAVDEYGDAAQAAVAAWDAMVVALEDEQDLELWNLDLTDADFDPYDRDAAYNACIAWSDAYTDGDNGKHAIREMKFWAWYLEEAAKLAGLQNYRFPPKFIKAFKEKQDPPKPVPEEVTLESFCEFLGVGEYLYNIKQKGEITYYNKKTDDYDITEKFDYYQITARLPQEYGVCPVCKQPVYNVADFYADKYLDWHDFALPKSCPQIAITRLPLLFRCPEHPREWIYNLPDKYENAKAAIKRYVNGEGRLEKLIAELERRTLKKYCNVWAYEIDINGECFRELADIEKKKEELGIVGAWVDEANGVYGLDLRQFSSAFYILRYPFEKFFEYARNGENSALYEPIAGDGTARFTVGDFKFKCTLEDGQPVFAEIRKK